MAQDHTSASGGNQTTTLQYFKWDRKYETVKPYVILTDAPDDFPHINFCREPGEEEIIADMRGHEANYSLDENGFAVRTHDIPFIRLDGSNVEDEYLPLARKLIQKEVGPRAEIVVFDWRIRSSDSAKTHHDPEDIIKITDKLLWLRPVEGVHIDQSPDSARRRVLHHLPERGDELLNTKRFRIINVWQPLSEVVEDYPLACLDGSTIAEKDTVAADVVHTDFWGEVLHPLYRKQYRWYYLSKQTRSEAILMKMFDSEEDIKARWCPHSSFKMQNASPSSQPSISVRESIEVRALVFTDR